MKKLSTLAAVLVMTGCGSTGVLPVGTAKAQAKPAGCTITIFEDAKDVGRPFEKLCLIDTKTGSTLYNDRSVSGAMKKVNAAACQCGADAVIVQGMEKKGVSLTSWGSSKVSVLAVRYTTTLPEDPVYLKSGTKLFLSSGEYFGDVVSTELKHAFADGHVGDAVRVKLAKGGEAWVTLPQAREMAAVPASAPAPTE